MLYIYNITKCIHPVDTSQMTYFTDDYVVDYVYIGVVSAYLLIVVLV